jgi:serine/threonine protein kinase
MADLIDDPELEALGQLAEEFLTRWRRGDQPSVADYAKQHPELADGIRALFPTLILMERSKPNRSSWTADDTRDDSLSHNLLPWRLGEYELVRELGRGGMGIVFEAKQEALDRCVAVKVLPGTAAYDDRTRQRFLREARTIARLRHPHIIPIHTVGEQDGVLFYVMDLIGGTSLDQLKPPDRVEGDGHARARWVARLGVQAAETLTYAHGEGILHRDVKPANFVLDQDGKLWLTDFGLAKLMGDPPLTATGEWLGTLRYLAPECLRGESSVRSDLYGLGLTLYELLVGVPAFPETDRARLIQLIAEGTPVPPRRHDPTIPRDLETIILKASAREPELRYESALELAEDLRRFLDCWPIRGHRTAPGARLIRWIRRNPAIASLALTSMALVLVIISLVTYYLFVPRRAASGLDSPSQPAPSPGLARDAQVSPPPPGLPKDGPPWGFGRRYAPAGVGAGGGHGPRGPRHGMGPQ